MAIEIVDFPMKNGGSFHCYVSSPEGKPRFLQTTLQQREVSIVTLGLTETAQYAGSTSGSKAHSQPLKPQKKMSNRGYPTGPH